MHGKADIQREPVFAKSHTAHRCPSDRRSQGSRPLGDACPHHKTPAWGPGGLGGGWHWWVCRAPNSGTRRDTHLLGRGPRAGWGL